MNTEPKPRRARVGTPLVRATAVVLAGGLGTRLRPVLSGRPKVLAEVAGRPFLAHLLDGLAAAGLRRVVICTGYMADQVRAALGTVHHGMRLIYSAEPSPAGTGGALRLALPLVESDPLLVLNGDSLTRADLAALWQWHHRRSARVSLLLTQVTDSDSARYGRVEVDDSGAVLHFAEKLEGASAGWVSAGVYVMAREVIEAIPEGRAVSLEREVLPAWVGRGLFGHQTQTQFIDIGTPEAFAAAPEFVSASRGTEAASYRAVGDGSGGLTGAVHDGLRGSRAPT